MKTKSSIAIGDTIDYRGMTSGYHDLSVTINIVDINKIVFVSGAESGYTEVFVTDDDGIQGGDSGGPAFYNNKVWGTVTSLNRFSYAENATLALNVTVCTTSSC